MPPGCEIKIQLTPNDPKVCIDCFDGSPGSYTVKIDRIAIHIPIGQMAAEIFNHFEKKLQNDVAKLHFRRLVVNILSVPCNTTFYESYNLFSGDVPCRLFAAFQSTSILNGDYKHSFMTFQRRWAKGSCVEQMNQRSTSVRHLPLPTIPGSRATETSVPSFLRRMIFGAPEPRMDVESEEQTSLGGNEELPTVSANADTDIFLKSVNLMFNGAPLQSLSNEDAQRDFDYSRYFLFLKATGCCQSGINDKLHKSVLNKALII